MKHLNYLWLAGFAALASCSSDEYLGEQEGLAQNGMKEISFASNTPNVTRANTRSQDADLLGRQFNVYGVKKVTDGYGLVFNDYSVWYKDGSQSESNAVGWEYVGSTPDFELVSGITRQKPTFTTPQSIKFWDYTADDYWFNAVSVANVSTPANETYAWTTAASTADGYTTGQVKTCVISNVNETNTVFFADPVKRSKSVSGEYAENLANGQAATNEPVKFIFKRLGAKVRIGFYETVPGYAINDVKFYIKEGTKSASEGATANLITTAEKTGEPAKFDNGFINSATGLTYTITYNYTGNGSATVDASGAVTLEGDKAFGTLDYPVTNSTYSGTSAKYMGEASSNPTWAKDASGNAYQDVFTNVENSASFKIKVDYTLTSTDGSKETIKVTGAEAVVPAQYCVWNANTAYTYLFKISDNTNGTTGTPGDPSDPSDPGDPAGLYPITFDACVADVINSQETITTVATPSITTHSTTSNVTTNDEYLSTETIILNVENYPANCTFKSWEYNVHEGAITEQQAEVLDRTTTVSWTNIALSDGKYVLSSLTAGKYYIVRLTYAEEFTPEDQEEVSTNDYTNSDLSTPVTADTKGNGSTKYYHKKYAYKVIKIKA